MTLYSEIEFEYRLLVDAVNTLNDYLLDATVIHAECYKLPPSSGDIANNTSGWEFLTPQTCTGFTALSMSVGAFSRFTPDYDHSAKYPFRLPGFIQLDPIHREQVTELIAHCNRHKQRIKSLLTTSKLNPGQKRELIQNICPSAITLQIYRLIKSSSAPVKRVGFTWCNKNSMRTIKKEEFLAYLKGSRENPPTGQTKAEWAPWVNKEIDLINAKAGALIKIKRPLPVAPKLNVSFMDDTATVMFYGHIPVIIFGEEPAKITPLKSYISQKNKKQLYNYLIQRLYVVSEQ